VAIFVTEEKTLREVIDKITSVIAANVLQESNVKQLQV
tara:strand:+ start:1546 stop:1659 length:114 start_codon:yes stop_codon:yes gene_type:complete